MGSVKWGEAEGKWGEAEGKWGEAEGKWGEGKENVKTQIFLSIVRSRK